MTPATRHCQHGQTDNQLDDNDGSETGRGSGQKRPLQRQQNGAAKMTTMIMTSTTKGQWTRPHSFDPWQPQVARHPSLLASSSGGCAAVPRPSTKVGGCGRLEKQTMKRGQVSFPPPTAQKMCLFVLVCAGLCWFVPFCAGVPLYCRLTDMSPPFLPVEKNRGQIRGPLVSKASSPPEKNCSLFLPRVGANCFRPTADGVCPSLENHPYQAIGTVHSAQCAEHRKQKILTSECDHNYHTSGHCFSSTSRRRSRPPPQFTAAVRRRHRMPLQSATTIARRCSQLPLQFPAARCRCHHCCHRCRHRRCLCSCCHLVAVDVAIAVAIVTAVVAAATSAAATPSVATATVACLAGTTADAAAYIITDVDDAS